MQPNANYASADAAIERISDFLEAYNRSCQRRADVARELDGESEAEISREYAFVRSRTRRVAQGIYREAFNRGKHAYTLAAWRTRSGAPATITITVSGGGAGASPHPENFWQSLFPTFRRWGRAFSWRH